MDATPTESIGGKVHRAVMTCQSARAGKNRVESKLTISPALWTPGAISEEPKKANPKASASVPSMVSSRRRAAAGSTRTASWTPWIASGLVARMRTGTSLSPGAARTSSARSTKALVNSFTTQETESVWTPPCSPRTV